MERIIDVFNAGLLAKLGLIEPGLQLSILAIDPLRIDKKSDQLGR